MIGSEILLYPDTGPEFLRSLKMAVLYSERVHVLTLLDKALIDSFLAHAESQGEEVGADERNYKLSHLNQPQPILSAGVTVAATNGALEYVRFAQDHYDDLSLLAREGLLVSDFQSGFMFGGTFRPDANIVRTLKRWPPSYWDLAGSHQLDEESAVVAAFQGYLCFIQAIAQQGGLALATWSRDFQQALWTSVAQLAEGGPVSTELPGPPPGKVDQRNFAQTQLVNVTLERYLPRVDDLPFSEILEIRRKYRSELERFRGGIRKLATEVDLTRPRDEIDLQLHDLVSKNVDPAVHDLIASVDSAPRNALRKLASDKTLVAIILGVAVGVLPDVTALLKGAAAAGLAVLAESHIERTNLLGSSRWSFLFRLTKLKRAH